MSFIGQAREVRRDLGEVIAITHPMFTLAAQVRKNNAEAVAMAVIELKTVSAAQAEDYIDKNVTTLASAKAALKFMVRMLIALRDSEWPDIVEKI